MTAAQLNRQSETLVSLRAVRQQRRDLESQLLMQSLGSNDSGHDYRYDPRVRLLRERQAELERLRDDAGTRLLGRRKALQMTQMALAKKAGVNATVISTLENGETLSTRHLAALATALGCDPIWLETGAGSWEPIAPPGPHANPTTTAEACLATACAEDPPAVAAATDEITAPTPSAAELLELGAVFGALSKEDRAMLLAIGRRMAGS